MKTPRQRAVARSTLQFGTAVMAVVLALATGPECLWLGPPNSTPGVESTGHQQSHHGQHVHGDSHETASNATATKLGDHCQCPMHRGVAPSTSGAAVSIFLVRQRIELSVPSIDFRIHFVEEFPASSCESALEPPVPIAFS